MRNGIVALAAAALLAVPGLSAAQGFGIAGRAGTLGFGAEGALGLSGSLVARGGVGLMPLEPTATIDDIDVTLNLPSTWYNVGLDLYLGGSFRLGGGILFKDEDPTLEGRFNSPQEIGDNTYTPEEIGTLIGTLDSSNTAPYALIGFGKHTSSGIGLFLDLGVALMGEPDVTLGIEGGQLSEEQVREDLDKQAQRFEDDAGSYLKFWPILNIGLRIGLGN